MTNPILGYDIDGQPLLAGDRVVLAVIVAEELDGYRDETWTVAGPADSNDESKPAVHLAERVGLAEVSTWCEFLRKLPPKQDHEPGSWEEIAKLGWKPNLAASTADC